MRWPARLSGQLAYYVRYSNKLINLIILLILPKLNLNIVVDLIKANNNYLIY